MKVLGVAGFSGSGKTTLIEKLLPRLRSAGLRVCVIKQSHHDFAVDVPGKDSWRFRAAGADAVLLTSPHRWMLVRELHGGGEPGLEAHLRRIPPCDLVLVEGYKHADIAKLEVWRAANAQPWLHPCETGFIAVAADRAPPGKIRHFPIDDIDTLTAFVLEYAL